ncbi:hypothetical protein RFI_10654, partial [Reticulomyxa filosa]
MFCFRLSLVSCWRKTKPSKQQLAGTYKNVLSFAFFLLRRSLLVPRKSKHEKTLRQKYDNVWEKIELLVGDKSLTAMRLHILLVAFVMIAIKWLFDESYENVLFAAIVMRPVQYINALELAAYVQVFFYLQKITESQLICCVHSIQILDYRFQIQTKKDKVQFAIYQQEIQTMVSKN